MVTRQNPIEEMERREALLGGSFRAGSSAAEIRLLAHHQAPMQMGFAPPWEKGGFTPSSGTRAAYERPGSTEEDRRREGMSVCVRFPITRKALWDFEAEGLPIHLTHASSLPSLLLPPSLVRSLADFLTSTGIPASQPGDLDWEIIGREVRRPEQTL